MTKELTFNTVTTFKNMRVGMVFTSTGGGLYMRLPVITSNHGRKYNAIRFPIMYYLFNHISILDERDISDFITKYHKMEDEGNTEKEIANSFNMTIPELRKTKSIYLAQGSIHKNVHNDMAASKIMYSTFADDTEVTYLFKI